jgi:hypothetical protein
MSHLWLFADSASRTNFELGRDLSSPVDWIVPAVVFLILAWFVVGMYLLDCVELGARFATLLIGLRLFAFVAILAVYLQPQWRTTRDVVNNSRVLVLADTSQSMGRRDIVVDDQPSGAQARMDHVIKQLSEGKLIPDLQQVHDVVVYRFDQTDQPVPIASFTKIAAKVEQELSAAQVEVLQNKAQQFRQRVIGGGVALLLGLAFLIWFLIRPAMTGNTGLWPLAVALAVLIGGGGTVAWAASQAVEELTMRQLVGLDSIAPETTDDGQPSPEKDEDDNDKQPEVDWDAALAARGVDTKLGQAVYQLIMDERATPLAAIIVISDGQQTAGLDVEAAAKVAAESEVPVYTVGLGDLEEPEFVRLADFATPSRAYLDDPFKVTAYVQSQGLSGRTAGVTLKQVAATDMSQQDADDTGLIYKIDTILGEDREDLIPVVFEVEGLEEPGRYAFELDIAIKGSGKLEDSGRRRFYIEVVDRPTKLLLLSGGPSREYQFLRNLLIRDKKKKIEVDVLLQSKRFDNIDDEDYLKEFPQTRDELAKYDGVIAIDPDWVSIGSSAVTMLETWVGEEAGGLIVIPGTVNAGGFVTSWIYNQKFEGRRVLFDLYPVEFHGEFEKVTDRPAGSKSAWSVQFTRAGMAADFLRLDDNPVESQRIWTSFEGIYGGFPVKDRKFGATVYATFDDSLAESRGYQPLWLAGHYYGSGRVFYLGSAEMWRFRRLDASYFEQFYTRLVRHVTMGRLHRGSKRGDVLLLEKQEYSVGDTVTVVAHLKNAQREPFVAESVPLYLFDANNQGPTITLAKDPSRDGTFRGEFVVREPQDYRLELPLPDGDNDVLSKIIKVTQSEREKKNPQQNDELLKSLSDETGGQYYSSFNAVLGEAGQPPLVPAIDDHARTTPIAGDIDPLFKETWSAWMMFIICGILCFEWLLRRLFKLA